MSEIMRAEKGIVKFFKGDKGFGFIRSGSKNIFFHIKNYWSPATCNTEISRIPEIGDIVFFRAENTQKGPATGVFWFEEDMEKYRRAIEQANAFFRALGEAKTTGMPSGESL